jgi:nitrogen regulatory protein PII
MKRVVAVLSADLVADVVDALVRQGADGVTLVPATSDGISVDPAASRSAEPWVRLEVVVESHRADDVIESVEAIFDSTERLGPPPRLMVENVEAVVHIRSGRIIT